MTGPTALTLDLDKQLSGSLPLFIGGILLASFLLLMIVFRSVARPAEGGRDEPALDRRGATASWSPSSSGAGWAGLFGLDRTFLIASPFPLLFFAVLFGLSMDYEVFLVSRIREAYLATGDTTESVARGLAATGRVITSGALIMVVVFLGFVTDPSPFVQDDRPGAGRGDRDRRHRRPHDPGAGDDDAHGPGQLVAARMARPAAALTSASRATRGCPRTARRSCRHRRRATARAPRHARWRSPAPPADTRRTALFPGEGRPQRTPFTGRIAAAPSEGADTGDGVQHAVAATADAPG